MIRLAVLLLVGEIHATGDIITPLQFFNVFLFILSHLPRFSLGVFECKRIDIKTYFEYFLDSLGHLDSYRLINTRLTIAA